MDAGMREVNYLAHLTHSLNFPGAQGDSEAYSKPTPASFKPAVQAQTCQLYSISSVLTFQVGLQCQAVRTCISTHLQGWNED